MERIRIASVRALRFASASWSYHGSQFSTRRRSLARSTGGLWGDRLVAPLARLTTHRPRQLLERLGVPDRLCLRSETVLALLPVHPSGHQPLPVQANDGRNDGEEEEREPTEVRELFAELR